MCCRKLDIILVSNCLVLNVTQLMKVERSEGSIP